MDLTEVNTLPPFELVHRHLSHKIKQVCTVPCLSPLARSIWRVRQHVSDAPVTKPRNPTKVRQIIGDGQAALVNRVLRLGAIVVTLTPLEGCTHAALINLLVAS